MTSYNANTDRECLTVESKLSEITRVSTWIEKIASMHAIPGRTQFAMELCLEEVVSNIIRHGYAGEPNHTLTIRFEMCQDGFVTLVVEDDASPFNPLLVEAPPVPRSLGDVSDGGQGIHLLKQFADKVEYEPKPTGNRLIIKFLSSESSNASCQSTSY